MIAIVDYGSGNILSIENALKRAGAQYTLSSDPKEILGAERVILPGVGDASYAMAQLRERELVEVVRSVRAPLLGICLGMQLLCESSSEGDVSCLGIIPTKVTALSADPQNKVPNIGWSEIYEPQTPLFKGVESGDFVYFVHSFKAEISDYTIATAHHSEPFSAAIGRDNFYGCQFHPEKSGDVGQRIINNFLEL